VSYARYVAHYVEAAAAATVIDGTAAIDGGGTLTVTGVRVVGGTVAVSGGGTLTATGTVTQVGTIDGTAIVDGGGSLTAAGTRVVLGTLVVAGGGTLTAVGVNPASVGPAVRGRLRIIELDDGRRRMEPHVFYATISDALVPQSATLSDADGAVDLSAAATIVVTAVGRRSGRTITANATGSALGVVTWEWSANDLDPDEGAEHEECALHIVATWGDGTILTWPTPGAGRLTLDPR
jgi:hypothetical protein